MKTSRAVASVWLLLAGGICRSLAQRATPPPDVKVTVSVDRDANARTINDSMAAGAQAVKTGDYDKAIAFFDEAIQMNPDDKLKATLYVDRGGAHGFKGELEKAVADFDEAIRINPKFAHAWWNRAKTHIARNEDDKAVEDYTESIRQDPDPAFACNDLAWLLATSPHDATRNGKKAVELAKQSCELTKWKNINSVGTLAAAYAEAGDFDQAVKYEEQQLTMPGLDKKQPAAAKKRLASYKARKPWREDQ